MADSKWRIKNAFKKPAYLWFYVLLPLLGFIKWLFLKFVTCLWFYVLRPILGHINWIFLVFLGFLAVASICMVMTHIYLVFNMTPPSIVEWCPNLLLGLFGTDVVTLKQNNQYGVIVADMIAICAFTFAVLPWIQGVVYKIKIKREIQEKFGFEFIPVKIPGEDDLVEMLKRYRGADQLTIFCGAFDWLGKNAKMRAEIEQLANENKLKLISFRSEEQVQGKFTEKGYQDLFETLKKTLKTNFRFDSGLIDIKCSVIRFFGGAKTRFLFRQSSEQNPFNAGFLGSSEYSRELLLILEKFTSAKDWGEPAAQFGITEPETGGGKQG